MLIINNLKIRFGARILFQDVNLQLSSGIRCGLVGSNGSGKTTFLKVLSGEAAADGGNVVISADEKLGTLKQDHFAYEQQKIRDVVIMGNPILWNALQKQEKLLSHAELSEEDQNAFSDIQEIIQHQDGYIAASKAAEILQGLGIDEKDHLEPLSILSGGYKLRVLLAQVLFSNPGVLLLDEPTNHLDIFSIKWLEGYLSAFPGILIVSSHDRHFLNRVCTHIADVDYGTIKLYKGDYDHFTVQKQQEREQVKFRLVNQEKRKEHLQTFVDRFGAKASKAKQAQSKMKQIEKLEGEMEELDLSPSSRGTPNVVFSLCRPSGVIPLAVTQISKAFSDKNVLHDISFEIDRGDKVAIIGPNGIGKSTLLKILVKEIQQDEGAFKWGFETHVAYFPQDLARSLAVDCNLVEWLAGFDPSCPEQQLRGFLGRVLFSGDDVKKPVNVLSGGEGARLFLAKFMLLKHNVLIFDEPTNHLDMEAIEELIKAIQNYTGTVLFVSHNAYFVSSIATRVIEMTPGQVYDFKGSYIEYLAERQFDYLNASGKRQTAIQKEPPVNYIDRKQQRNRRGQLKQAIEKLEKECAHFEKAIADMDLMFSEESFYEKTAMDKQQELMLKKMQLEKQLEQTLKQWEEQGRALLEFES